MNKFKKGFTLVELIISVFLLVVVFIILYELYMKGYILYEDNQNKVKVEMDLKNFSDTLYSYLKSSYQNSIKVIEDENALYMIIPEKSDPVEYKNDENNYYDIKFTKKEDYIELVSLDKETKIYEKTEALKGSVREFILKPFYSGDVLSKVTINLKYSFGKNKVDEMVLDYVIRN